MRIRLNLINDINVFVKTCSQYYEGNILVSQGCQTVSAKSLLGVYSLDLSKPLDVVIDTDNKRIKNDFYNYISKWKVEE